VPVETAGTYNAKELRKWCARTTRVAMMVAEHYVNTHLDLGDEHIREFHETAVHTEKLHDIITTKDDTSDSPPLTVSDSAWRSHVKHHNERCRGDQ
jgi:hypothetical protein